MLAITRRDDGRGALVLRIDLMQSLVQLRRAGDGQRREKGDDHSDADPGARLHAGKRTSRCETLRKLFEPWERAGEFNSVPILTPKLVPLGDCGRITNRNGDFGESSC